MMQMDRITEDLYQSYMQGFFLGICKMGGLAPITSKIWEDLGPERGAQTFLFITFDPINLI